MNKKLLQSCLVIVLLISLTVGVFAAEKVTLRFSWWGSQTRHDITLKIIELFEEKYPEIDVQPEFTGWGGYWDRLNTQMAANNLPDVFQNVNERIPTYISNKSLLDLTPYLENGTLDTSNIPDSLANMGKIDGKIYGMATGVNAPASFYDKELYDKAGVAYPTPDRTWEDEVEMIKELHEKLGIYGSSSLTAQTDMGGFTVYVRQHGKDIYNEDGTALGYEDDQLYIDFMNMALDLIDSGAVTNAAMRAEGMGGGIENSLIARQEAAYLPFNWSNKVGALTNAAGKILGITTLPSASNQAAEGRFVKAAMLFTVSADTEHPEETIKFLDFYYNNMEAGLIQGTGRGVPINNEIKAALKENASEVDQVVFDFIDLAAKYAGEPLQLTPPASAEVTDVFEDVFWKVIFKQITPEEGAKEFREKANNILAQ